MISGRHIIVSILCTVLFLITGCLTDNDSNDDPRTHTVTGRTIDQMNAGIERVAVALIGETGEGMAVTRRVFTDVQGTFKFEHVGSGTYTVTPNKDGFSFYPPNRFIAVEGADISLELFISSRPGGGTDGSYSLSGAIVDSYGIGLSGITVALSGDGLIRATTTGRNGSYRFDKVPSGAYRLTPGSNAYSFIPSSLEVFVRGYDVTIGDITALEAGTGSDGGLETGAGTHEYYPMRPGIFRSFRVKETDYDSGGLLYEYNHTETVRDVIHVGGNDYWRIIDDDGGIVKLLRFEDDTVFGFSEQALVFIRSGDFRIITDNADDPLYRELPLIRFDVPQNETYTILEFDSSGDSDYGAFFALHQTGTFAGTEDVATVIGTFENCRKYSFLFDSYAVSGNSSRRDTTQVFIWYAKDTGPVKQTELRSTDGRSVFKRTSELTGFSVP